MPLILSHIVVIIFLEKSINRLENLYLIVLEHDLSEYIYFWITCAIFEICQLTRKKNGKILILIQFFFFFFSFFISNPLMDRSSHLDLVAQPFYCKTAFWELKNSKRRFSCKIFNFFKFSRLFTAQ